MSSSAKTFGLSSSLNEEVTLMAKNQGIVSILGPDCHTTKSPTLRRTLSADMSSRKWLSQHGFSPLKKIASSEQFLVSSTYSSPSEGDDDYEEVHQGQSEIWNSIQEKKEKNQADKKPGQFDTWSSILSQKSQESKDLPPLYVHPLVKRSASSLSEKSLEICTESLGSETGSDGFSSYPPSETGDAEDDDKEEEQPKDEKVAQKFEMEDWRVAKYNLAAASRQKSSAKSFPPSIPSLSSRDGASMHMRCRRDNGRLVLEAVSVPAQNNFRAQRQDGRLVLTFIDSSNEVEEERVEVETKRSEADQFEVELGNCEEEKEPEEKADLTDDEEEEEEEVENDGGEEKLRIVTELTPNLPNGVVSVHKLVPLMIKSMALGNRTPRWPKKFNTPVKFEEEEDEEEEVMAVKPITPLTQSLPPRPPVARMIPSPLKETVTAIGKAAATSASFNTYEYFWKPKGVAGTATVLNPTAQKPSLMRRNINNYNNNKVMVLESLMGNDKKEMVVLRGSKGDYLFPFCKELRRSFLFREPYCVATS